MLPSFVIEGGLPLALARGLWVAALLSACGTLAFWTLVVPRALARAPLEVRALVHRGLARLTAVTMAVAVGALALWVVLQSSEIAGLDATITVLRGTVFGHLVLIQMAGLLAVCAALAWRRPAGRWLAAGLAAAVTVVQAGHGHALAMADGPSLLLASTAVHLLAAAGWLGGLVPLLLVVRVAPARVGAGAARWFSPLGKLCVVAVIGSAAVQFWELIGGVPWLVGTAYGWMALVKLLLLLALLGFAAINRYHFAPRLMGADPVQARAALSRSILLQTAAGLAVVLAAALLSSLPPSLHEQPVWPFAERPSLVMLGDPDLRGEALHGAAELLAGLGLLVAGAALYRRRYLAVPVVAVGLAIGMLAAPHLDLFFVEAYPTSYFQSPTGFAATSIMQGDALFPGDCASCHGAEGRGDGPAAKGLADPPADLTAGHLWAHEDGELFWWLSHGIDAPEGGLAMPGFAATLPAESRWALIDYVRAHNAGITFHDTGQWPVPVQAPGFSLSCPGRPAVTSGDLRGSVVHLVTRADAVPPSLDHAPAPVVTVLLTQSEPPAAPGVCVASDPAVWAAYAVILGVAPQDLAGAQMLIDPEGWMRAAQRPGDGVMRWANPALLLADVQTICRHPIGAISGGHVHH